MEVKRSSAPVEWVVPFRLGLRVAYSGAPTAAFRIFVISVLSVALLFIAGWYLSPLLREYVVTAAILFLVMWIVAMLGFAGLMIISAVVDRIWPTAIKVSANTITLPRSYTVPVVDLKSVDFVRLHGGAHVMVLDWGLGERRFGVPSEIDVTSLEALLRRPSFAGDHSSDVHQVTNGDQPACNDPSSPATG